MASLAVRDNIHPGIARLALAASIAALAHGTAAAQVEVKQHGCKAGVELVARNAPLAVVLDHLSKTLGFRLDIDGELDGSVNRRIAAPAPQLLADLLSSHSSHVIWHGRDPQCPGQLRVARVWLVAASTKTPTSAAVRPPAAPPPLLAPAPATPPAPVIATREQLQHAEEQSRRRKAEYDSYLAAHGKPPPGEPEDAAKP
jgi:hypothetical protein